MKLKKPFLLLLGVIILIVLVFILLLLVIPSPVSARQAAIRVEIANYTTALAAFSNEFGFLPVGSNSAVTAALAGKNPGQKVFITFSSKALNRLGEFLDPSRNPYDIYVTTNDVHIAPKSK